MENILFDLLDLTPAARYRHNRTGVEYTLADVREISLMEYRVLLSDDAGRVFQIPPRVLETLYSRLEDPEPVGILPIGSVSLDATEQDPPPGPDQDDDNELLFRRPGRPSNSPREFDSYFGQPRKHGPRKK